MPRQLSGELGRVINGPITSTSLIPLNTGIRTKKIITCLGQAYPAMSHVIKRDIFRKTQSGGRGAEEKMKGRLRDTGQ